MGVFAFAAFFGILPFMLQYEETGADVIANRVANLFVIAIPPALPAAMSSGMIFAIRRLKQQRIFCIAPQRVNVAGRITTFVFDKTGTLTEDGLSVQGYKFQQNERFSDFSKDFIKLLPQKSEIFATKCPVGREDTSLLFLEACASCTAITYVDGKLVGDTLDVRMFEATGWIQEEDVRTVVYPKLDGNVFYKSTLVRRFDFSSALQRMSVICQNQIDDKLRAFVKGSPEKIKDLSKSVPADYEQTVEQYTREGFRVIALAHKELSGMNTEQAMEVKRDSIESDLEFLGLLVMENKLKPESKAVIHQL